MKKKEVKRAFDAYSKTGDIYTLSRTMRKLLLYFIHECHYGIDIDFLEMLPFVEKRLKSLNLGKKKVNGF